MTVPIQSAFTNQPSDELVEAIRCPLWTHPCSVLNSKWNLSKSRYDDDSVKKSVHLQLFRPIFLQSHAGQLLLKRQFRNRASCCSNEAIHSSICSHNTTVSFSVSSELVSPLNSVTPSVDFFNSSSPVSAVIESNTSDLSLNRSVSGLGKALSQSEQTPAKEVVDHLTSLEHTGITITSHQDTVVLDLPSSPLCDDFPQTAPRKSLSFPGIPPGKSPPSRTSSQTSDSSPRGFQKPPLPPPSLLGRRLNWKPFSSKISQPTVFDEIKVDPSIIMTNFRRQPKNMTSTNQSRIKNSQNVEEINVLSHQKAQNLMIIARKMKIQPLLIVQNIMELDMSLKRNELDKFVKFIPNDDEVRRFEIYFQKGGTIGALREVDRLVARLLPSKIPTLNLAVKILSVRHDLEDLRETIEEDLLLMLRGCSSIFFNKGLRHLLAICLRVGDFIQNAIGPLDNLKTRGFYLESLRSLAEFKSHSTSGSLLHYVLVAMISDRDPTDIISLLTLEEPLRAACRAAKICTEQTLKRAREELMCCVTTLIKASVEVNETVSFVSSSFLPTINEYQGFLAKCSEVLGLSARALIENSRDGNIMNPVSISAKKDDAVIFTRSGLIDTYGSLVESFESLHSIAIFVAKYFGVYEAYNSTSEQKIHTYLLRYLYVSQFASSIDVANLRHSCKNILTDKLSGFWFPCFVVDGSFPMLHFGINDNKKVTRADGNENMKEKRFEIDMLFGPICDVVSLLKSVLREERIVKEVVPLATSNLLESKDSHLLENDSVIDKTISSTNSSTNEGLSTPKILTTNEEKIKDILRTNLKPPNPTTVKEQMQLLYSFRKRLVTASRISERLTKSRATHQPRSVSSSPVSKHFDTGTISNKIPKSRVAPTDRALSRDSLTDGSSCVLNDNANQLVNTISKDDRSCVVNDSANQLIETPSKDKLVAESTSASLVSLSSRSGAILKPKSSPARLPSFFDVKQETLSCTSRLLHKFEKNSKSSDCSTPSKSVQSLSWSQPLRLEERFVQTSTVKTKPSNIQALVKNSRQPPQQRFLKIRAKCSLVYRSPDNSKLHSSDCTLGLGKRLDDISTLVINPQPTIESTDPSEPGLSASSKTPVTFLPKISFNVADTHLNQTGSHSDIQQNLSEKLNRFTVRSSYSAGLSWRNEDGEDTNKSDSAVSPNQQNVTPFCSLIKIINGSLLEVKKLSEPSCPRVSTRRLCLSNNLLERRIRGKSIQMSGRLHSFVQAPRQEDQLARFRVYVFRANSESNSTRMFSINHFPRSQFPRAGRLTEALEPHLKRQGTPLITNSTPKGLEILLDTIEVHPRWFNRINLSSRNTTDLPEFLSPNKLYKSLHCFNNARGIYGNKRTFHASVSFVASVSHSGNVLVVVLCKDEITHQDIDFSPKSATIQSKRFSKVSSQLLDRQCINHSAFHNHETPYLHLGSAIAVGIPRSSVAKNLVTYHWHAPTKIGGLYCTFTALSKRFEKFEHTIVELLCDLEIYSGNVKIGLAVIKPTTSAVLSPLLRNTFTTLQRNNFDFDESNADYFYRLFSRLPSESLDTIYFQGDGLSITAGSFPPSCSVAEAQLEKPETDSIQFHTTDKKNKPNEILHFQQLIQTAFTSVMCFSLFVLILRICSPIRKIVFAISQPPQLIFPTICPLQTAYHRFLQLARNCNSSLNRTARRSSIIQYFACRLNYLIED